MAIGLANMIWQGFILVNGGICHAANDISFHPDRGSQDAGHN